MIGADKYNFLVYTMTVATGMIKSYSALQTGPDYYAQVLSFTETKTFRTY